MEKQNEFRLMLESEPLRFFVREFDELIESARSALSAFVNCNVNDLVFATNATVGVNTILRSLEFKSGDNILITDQIYPACRNAVNYIAKKNNLVVIEVKTDLPIKHKEIFADKIISSANNKTCLALIDHISSLPGILAPIELIVKELNIKGIDTLVDGAHAPGMIDLNVDKIGAAYYTGNCHKWMCTPKGSAFLYVREDKQKEIFPLVISRLSDEDDFQLKFSWQGTQDYSALLCIPFAIEFISSLYNKGWKEHIENNHNLVFKAAKKICDEFSIEMPYPEDMCGSIYGIPFGKDINLPEQKINIRSEIQEMLFYKYNIEAMISYWRNFPDRLLRIAAQTYNTADQYEILIDALKKENVKV